MWKVNTFPPTSYLVPHIKSASCHPPISSFWHSVEPKTAILGLEGKQSHLLRIKRNICKAGREAELGAHTSSIAHIKWMLSTFEDGRISISPYDTAWVALIPNVDGGGSPQFPSSIEWIAENQRIPKGLMHEVPTAILFSLEGIEGSLKWDKLLKLITEDGCFLTSPSSTAFAFMQTGDDKCLKYLTNIVTKFSGGAPTVYPIDVFARLWAVDRLQRLGISHIFAEQIAECLNYVHRYWTASGVFSARNSPVCDLDDTSMGFRLLRLQGYNVSPDVFKHFKSNDNKFCCFGGELNASPTTLLNLYKACQVKFPGENILDDAEIFSYNFLKEKLLENEIVDKWVISKDFAGELKFGVEIPWYACLPRVEARFYIEQYGGADDVWIAKTFYRVAEISNHHYLEVAKLEFNECQAQHLHEWTNILKWWKKFKLEEYGLRREDLLVTFYVVAASIFESGRSVERCAWTKSWAIIQLLQVHFNNVAVSRDKRNTFFCAFKRVADGPIDHLDEMGKGLQWVIQEFIYQLSIHSFQTLRRDMLQELTNLWETWLIESLDCFENGRFPHEGAFLSHIVNLCSGNITSVSSIKLLSLEKSFKHLCYLTDKVCLQLRQYQKNKGATNGKPNQKMGRINSEEIDKSMQELLQLVVQNESSDDIIDRNVKETFLIVARAYYYTAFIDKKTLNIHIAKVFFEPIL
ncbi:OLC1v1002125C1 [Oldenlandia corymbosa var. corymbosa]|uniref:OLC1v1002125C1 n=1 Tax=Oldenlandia corymbosa var. corymbosa TaxID=529605 RepID=A0AAV1D7L9_OLDCO|nr:OLC1v1002125C1 [Oldenlandia corymbosa var. corymbosa]